MSSFRRVVAAVGVCVFVTCAAITPTSALAGEVARPARDLTPNQLTDGQHLTPYEALAACAPAAAVAMARALGLDPTLDEAVDLARGLGWSAAFGMSGAKNQAHLLAYLGVAARLHDGDGVDWDLVVRHVSVGNPVIVIAPGHYFVVEGYAPELDKFDFGNSAAVLRAAGGQRLFGRDEVGMLGFGEPRQAIYLERPLPVLSARGYALADRKTASLRPRVLDAY